MPDFPPESSQSAGRVPATRIVLRALVVLGAVLAVLVVVALTLYANRRAVARHLAEGWLERRGIAAEVLVERLELDGFTGRIRLGRNEDPDLAIERIDARYRVSPPWSSSGFAVALDELRLLRPVLRASWQEGRFSLGSLDPLLEEFTTTESAAPPSRLTVLVQQGELLLDAGQGRLQLLADAKLVDGRLMRLAARLPVARVAADDLQAQDLRGALNLNTTGERVAFHIEATAGRVSSAQALGEGARLTLRGELPYPDLASPGAEGALMLRADLRMSGLQARDGELREVASHLAFDGEVAGTPAELQVSGEGNVQLTAAAATQPLLAAQDLLLTLGDARFGLFRDGQRMVWSLKSGATMETAQLHSGEISLQKLRAAASLDITDSGTGGLPRIAADASLQVAQGAWPLLGAPAMDDAPALAGMKRALQSFAVRVPAVQLRNDSAGMRIELASPARVVPANGGALAFMPLARPVYQAAPGQQPSGAVRLVATPGRGLPQANISVPDWRLTADGFAAELDAQATVDMEPAQGLQLRTRGLLAQSSGRLTYTARDCVAASVQRLELGENDLEALAGTLCPDGAPLLVWMNDSWKVQGAFNAVSAAAPSVAVQASALQGQVKAEGLPRDTTVELALASGQIADTMHPARFNPLTVSGSAALAGERWGGAVDLALPGYKLGELTLAHNSADGSGGVRIEVPEVKFSEAGLQPAQLSPLAASYMQSPASGSIHFHGRIDWSGEASTSSGLLSIPGMDFTSPAGAVKGLQGQVEFTSLLPLVTAPAQSLMVDQLVAATEVTGLNVVFALDAASLRVAEGEVSAGGGRIRAVPFALPLDLSQPFNGTIVLESVNLGKVLADAGLGERVALEAVVSGRLPFVWTPEQGLRVVGGVLSAVQPGRVTVHREVLTDVQSSGSTQAPPGMVEDLAYQAMENLAFDTLSAEVNSLDGGRMGVVFRIKGRHDPPQRQQLRVGLVELITRRFMERTLPLPSDTQIDLTLDTTLNLNQLLADLLAVNRARQGEPAAPGP